MIFIVPQGTHIVPGVGCIFEGAFNTDDESVIAILKAFFAAPSQDASALDAEPAPAPVEKKKKSTILTTDGFVDAGIAKPIKE
jgi:hypothetical protein